MTTAALSSLRSDAAQHRTRRQAILPVLLRLLLVVVSGLLLSTSFAPRAWWWMAPLAFAGLGVVLHNRRARSSAMYGTVFGLAFYLTHLVWIDDFLGSEFGPGPWLALSGVLALYLGAACAVMPLVARLPAAPVGMALVFLIQEAARSRWPVNGFPWGRAGFSQSEGGFLPLASIGGVPLLSFAVVVTGFGLAQLLIRARRRRWRVDRAWLAPALTVCLPLCLGLALWPTVGTAADNGTRTVAVVQGNAPDAGIGLLDERETIRTNHLDQTGELAEQIRAGEVDQPDLTVWPETATDLPDGEDPEIDALVDEIGTPALIGALYQDEPGGRTENSVLSWEPGAGPGQHYTKQELVPFSEYVPLRPIAQWFTPFLDRTRDMQWGSEPGTLSVADTDVGAAICYEAAYDYVSRETAENGSEVLVFPTNNAWFGTGEMSHQQLAMAQIRSVEHGKATVVAATSGISAIIEPDGTVSRSTDLYTADSLVAEVPLRQQVTLADQLGGWTEYVLVGAGVVAALAGFALRWHSRKWSRRTEREHHGGGSTAQGQHRPGAGDHPDL